MRGRVNAYPKADSEIPCRTASLGEARPAADAARSVSACEQPVGHRAQRRSPLTERQQRRDRLDVEQLDTLLRGRDADDGGVRGLCMLAIGAGGLAERRHISEQVEQIVLDLEREPDGDGEALERT